MKEIVKEYFQLFKLEKVEKSRVAELNHMNIYIGLGILTSSFLSFWLWAILGISDPLLIPYIIVPISTFLIPLFSYIGRETYKLSDNNIYTQLKPSQIDLFLDYIFQQEIAKIENLTFKNNEKKDELIKTAFEKHEKEKHEFLKFIKMDSKALEKWLESKAEEGNYNLN